MKKIALFSALPLLAIALLTSLPLFAASRSINVVSRFDGDTIRQRFSIGTNYAVMIGINTYSHHPNLKTAVNDAEAVARLLKEKYFFSPENIYIIKDTDAPRTVSSGCYVTLWLPRWTRETTSSSTTPATAGTIISLNRATG